MSKNPIVVLSAALLAGPICTAAADPLPRDASFTTLITTPLAIEGLTGDSSGNLYTTGRGVNPCPVWKISIASPFLVTIGFIPGACQASGIAFDEAGKLYVADSGVATVWTLAPSESAPPTATAFATGVPGTNGIAFDGDGNLWTGDGTTGQGRVWKIGPSGGNCATAPNSGCREMFRIQPMSNEVNLVAGVGGVGRDVRTLPPGTITVLPASRNAANTLGSQPLVANGLAFNHEGDLFVADTARGAIWKVEFDRRGALKSRMGCDTTFTANTLCLENVLVAHPFLEGTDGIALDRAGNIWNSANERNAIVVVTKQREVIEVFRNPVNATTQLRNAATDPRDDNRILETPTSPVLLGRTFCTANSDGNRRDNSPNTVGEIKPAGPDVGKISCMDQDLTIPGLPLPVR